MKFISAKLIALLLLALLAAATTMAGPGRGQQGPANPEVRAYYREQVLPVLRQQRQKLEAQLSADDKALLATYRTQLKDLRQRGHALHAGGRPESRGEGARPALTEAERQQRQQLHADRKAIMRKVRELAAKHEAAMQQLAGEVAPQREKWAADLKALVAKNAGPANAGPAPQSDDKLWEGPGAHHGRGRHQAMEHPFGPVRFLLLNPGPPAATSRDLGSSLYPNPAGASSQLEYSVKKAGPVTIELLDAQGNKLRTVAQETNQEKGPHTQSLHVGDLPAGTYYYKITTRSGAETKRFVKE